MNDKSKTFWKFALLYFASVLLVGIAVFKNVKSSPKMKATSMVSAEAQLVNQHKLLFKIQKINQYLIDLDSLEDRLMTIENNAYEIGQIKTKIDRKTLRLRAEIEKYREESDGELYAEVFKNFDRLVSLLIVNEGLKKENLYAKEALDDCKEATSLTLK